METLYLLQTEQRKREWERIQNFLILVRLPTPTQLIRSDLERETRTNLPINHCAYNILRTFRKRG